MEGTAEGRFWLFHLSNPHVYAAIVSLCRRMRRRGIDRWSINGVFEILRWRATFKTNTAEDWKLNNTYRAHYARLVMFQEPDLHDFFETRSRRDEAA